MMRHKRRQVLTIPITFEQFEKQVYSARLFNGTIFINLKDGQFGYKDDLNHKISTHTVYDRTHTAKDLEGNLIAKRKTKDQLLRRIKYLNQ